MIWVAWVNGSIYLELHGREDGRTRSVVFIQMGVLAILAVFTSSAAEDGGRPFAVVYTAFLVFMTWLWFTVRREDRVNRPEFLPATGRYLKAMVVSVVVILASAFLAPEPRLLVWADVKTISTGLIALVLGFGLWWIYFDIIGRRLMRDEGPAIVNWVLSHLPITMSIAACGAAMVSLITHAHESNTPETTAWLLSGAVALGLLAEVVTARTLEDARRLAVVYRPLTVAMAGGAVAALLGGWSRPSPWLLALLLVAILSVLWIFAVIRFLRVDAWGTAR
jgi:low temperature requirement protein LtrA